MRGWEGKREGRGGVRGGVSGGVSELMQGVVRQGEGKAR